MPGTSSTIVTRLLACLLALGVLAPIASGQETEGQDTPDPQPTSVIAIDVDAFGVGNVVRPGEWTGVRLILQDVVSTAPRAVAVRLHVPDPDGDTMLAQREVTLTPGRRQGVWVYAPMPWTMPAYFTVTIHELGDSQGSETSVGRQLSAKRIAPQAVREPRFDFIGVVGSRVFGLNQYELGMTRVAPLSSQESFDVVSGMAPEDLPDRWEGLLQYETIVWGDADPARLGTERPRALEEWVRHGGHLVIVMPPVGGIWFTNDDPLASIMPEANAIRVEGVSYEPYRRLLTTKDSDRIPLPSNATVHAFERAQGVDPMRAAPLIDGPHGVVVTRRLVGVGMVTVVGLDLSDPEFVQRRIFRADGLWHRILGKTFPIPFPDNSRNAIQGSRPQPQEQLLDRHFAGSIENTAQAGVGILLAVVVFVAYWLAAGPLGFGLLKMNNWQRHAWVAFLGTVGVFAVIAWLGAQTLADTTVRAKHLTFLDHVYGQSYQRTRTFAGVMMPGYGDRTISVKEGAVDTNSRNLISGWSDPTGFGLTTRFPDARAYVYSVRDGSSLRSPVRSTVKTVRAEWGGGVVWQTPRPTAPAFEPRLEGANRMSGRLVHGLPGGLEGVQIILCYGQTDPGYRADPDNTNRKNEGLLYSRFRVWKLDAPWAPGVELDLKSVAEDATGSSSLLFRNSLTDNADNSAFFNNPGTSDARTPYSWVDARKDAERLTWRPLVSQPGWNNTQWLRKRQITRAGHGLDLARFMTMPCVIVTGHLRGEESPTPLRLGGETGDEIPMDGHTMVRWVFPLTPDPVNYE